MHTVGAAVMAWLVVVIPALVSAMAGKDENATLGAVCNANGLWQWVICRDRQRYGSHREYLTERTALTAGRRMLEKLAKLSA